MLDSDIMTSEKTAADFREGMQDDTASLTQYWFIQTAFNSKQLLFPKQEFTSATFEGWYSVLSRGNQGWRGPPGWRASRVPKHLQSRPKETKREPLWDCFELICIFFCSCLFSEWQNVPKAGLRPGKGFLTVLTQALTPIRKPCHTRMGLMIETNTGHLPGVRQQSNTSPTARGSLRQFSTIWWAILQDVFGFFVLFCFIILRISDMCTRGFGIFPLNYSQPPTHFPPNFTSILYL